MSQSPKCYSKFVVNAVWMLKQQIDACPLKRSRIPDLLNETSVGTNMIRAAFREMVGVTIVQYQMRKRLEKAAAYLAEGEHSIQQVAVICGYRNKLANFSNDFRKIHGVPPREWVRKNEPVISDVYVQLQQEPCLML